MSNLNESVNALRFLSVDVVENANSGHPGLPMGMADVATILFQEFLKFYPLDPHWQNRDRFILSAGHGSALLYSLLHLCGYKALSLDHLKKFRQLGSITPGHPEFGHTDGVEATTGPLGQGIAMAVGMALAQKRKQSLLKNNLCQHKIYALISDGDLMEGISQEAISIAGHFELSNLILLFDDNGITIDGKTSLSTSDDTLARFKSSNFDVISIDGHNHEEIRSALSKAQHNTRPTLIACKTVIGYGSPTKAGLSSCHGSPLGQQEVQNTRQALGWNYPPFIIPEDIRQTWINAAFRFQKEYQDWQVQIQTLPKDTQEFILDKIPDISPALFLDIKEAFIHNITPQATRISSQNVLESLTQSCTYLVGGSADLTPSNNTKTSSQKILSKENWSGNYIHFGIREHGMAAILNGLSLYGGIIPYGGTFLVFSDYLRPSLRLSALMKRQVVYVLTHDSIGLGEDGPTHQPIEHLASLRAIPNVYVFRPCDCIETTESWQTALNLKNSPSILALSRQNLPLIRKEIFENKTQKGGYVIVESIKPHDITLIASGSEVSIAIEAAQLLLSKNINARVVSMPCLDLFEEQDTDYQQKTIGDKPCIVVEAGIEMCWGKYTKNGGFVGMHSFGASGKATDLFKEFNITTDNIIKTVEEVLKI